MSARYQTVGHDSIQYHFFCAGRIFAFRIFRTETLEHHSAWIYADGHVREVLSSESPITQTNAPYLDVAAAMFSLKAEEPGGVLNVFRGNRDDSFSATFLTRQAYHWNYLAEDLKEDVLHQPDLKCEIKYRGEVLLGLGYHKRYYWPKPPRYWGYRFLHGVADGGDTVLWTADAMFGFNKYDYFKVLDVKSGHLAQAGDAESAHKQNRMFGFIGGQRHDVHFDEQGAWDTLLISPVMNSHMRQRAGRMTWKSAGQERTGPAITEYCFGTLG